jgi:hypothetical protein
MQGIFWKTKATNEVVELNRAMKARDAHLWKESQQSGVIELNKVMKVRYVNH